MPFFEEYEDQIKKRLCAATGYNWDRHRNWDKNLHHYYVAFADTREGKILVDVLKQAAIESKAAKKKDFASEALKYPLIQESNWVTRGPGWGVEVDARIAQDPNFLETIAKPVFRENVNKRIADMRERQLQRKRQALAKLTGATNRGWEVKEMGSEFPSDPTSYHLETFNDRATNEAILRVLEPIQRRIVRENDDLFQKVNGQYATTSHSLLIMKNSNITPEIEDPSRQVYRLTIPSSLIEDTDFIDRIPERLRAQITQARRDDRQGAPQSKQPRHIR